MCDWVKTPRNHHTKAAVSMYKGAVGSLCTHVVCKMQCETAVEALLLLWVCARLAVRVAPLRLVPPHDIASCWRGSLLHCSLAPTFLVTMALIPCYHGAHSLLPWCSFLVTMALILPPGLVAGYNNVSDVQHVSASSSHRPHHSTPPSLSCVTIYCSIVETGDLCV